MPIIKRIAATLLILTLILNCGFMFIVMVPSIKLVIGMEQEETVVEDAGPMDLPPALLELYEKLYWKIRFSSLDISLCLRDFETGAELEIQGHKPIYPASMIKTLLLLATLKQVETGRLSFQDTHTLSDQDKYAGETPVTGTGTLQFAEPGTVISLDELLSLMITISDNVAANILYDLVGPDNVNARAGELGLQSTAFTRKMYEVDSPLPSNVSTVCDLTKMLVALEQRKVVGNELSEKGIDLMKQTDDKGRIGRYIGDEVILANKVGTVPGIIGDMALLYFPNRPPLALTIAVLDPGELGEAARVIGSLTELIVDALSPGTPVTVSK
jgi:beta-lactamase class A